MRPVDTYIKEQLTGYLDAIGQILRSDVVAVLSPILPGLEIRLRDAVDQLNTDSESVSVILDTEGGIIEIVERMVTTLRFTYNHVTIIVPNRAMSAGTLFALSADRIMMDHLSCLGPIDPQIEKEGKLVPALSYLIQFERLNQKASEQNLTTAEYALLEKLDLGELYQFEQSRELSIELLIKWLSRYKFKNWSVTEDRKMKVTASMKKDRAQKIADLLNNPDRWHSHGRAIDMRTLQEEVGLQIDDLEEYPDLHNSVQKYFGLLKDYMHRQELISFVHTKEYF